MIKFKEFFKIENDLTDYFKDLIEEVFEEPEIYEGWSYGHYFVIGSEVLEYSLEVFSDGKIELCGSNTSVNAVKLVKFLEKSIEWEAVK